MKTIKRNISKSCLFTCLSLTIATVVFASVRSFGLPSSPGRPEATSIWADRCTINYLPPVSNGGSPVTAYIIESRDMKTYRWVPKGSSRYLFHHVSYFSPGSTHQFRVSAQNAAGVGNPSGASNPVTFKDPYEK